MNLLKPYPEYKDSGVPWLGEVPRHWSQLPGKACYREKKAPNTGMQEATVLSLSYGQIIIKPVEKLHGLVPASFETYQIINPGDIIVRPTDLQNDWNSLRFGLSRHRGIITSAYMCLNTNGAMTPEYGHLLLHTYDLKKVFYGLGSGLRQNLDWHDFKYLPCLVPPRPEQLAIVKFLTHYDRLVRRFIRNRRRLIEVLNEQKQAIINQAVTRGLDPNVPLKPSGIDWLGDIPEHWQVTTLARLAKTFKTGPFGSILHRSDYVSGRIPLVNPIHMSNGEITPDNDCTVDQATLNRLREYVLQEGDLVFSRRGELGRCALVRKDQAGWLLGTGSIRVQLIVDAINSEYVIAALQGRWVGDYLSLMSVGATMQSLNTGILSRLPLPLPPRKEQVQIPEHVERETALINRAVANAKREVALVREYRTRLIADVVTGKLDVRHLAPASGDEITEVEHLDEGIDEEEIQEDDEPELVEEVDDGKE